MLFDIFAYFSPFLIIVVLEYVCIRWTGNEGSEISLDSINCTHHWVSSYPSSLILKRLTRTCPAFIRIICTFVGITLDIVNCISSIINTTIIINCYCVVYSTVYSIHNRSYTNRWSGESRIWVLELLVLHVFRVEYARGWHWSTWVTVERKVKQSYCKSNIFLKNIVLAVVSHGNNAIIYEVNWKQDDERCEWWWSLRVVLIFKNSYMHL